MPDSASSNQGESSNDEKEGQKVENFLEDSHKTFTLLGLFAALSVYLSQTPGELNVDIQMGIGGSLIIFVIVAFVVISNAFEHAQNALNQRNYLRFFAYFTIVFCLMGLIFAVMSIMNRYSEGTIPLIDAGMSVGIAIAYISYVLNLEDFIQYEGETSLEELVPFTPYISLILLIGLHLSTGAFREPLGSIGDEGTFGMVLGFALVHFMVCMSVSFSLSFLDRGIAYVYSNYIVNVVEIDLLDKYLSRE